ALAGLAWLWFHGHRGSDLLAAFGPQGRVGGVISSRGRLLFVVTNVELGAERAWTAEARAISLDDADKLGELVTDTPLTAGRWGFAVGRKGKDAFGLAERWCTFVGVPSWAVMLLPLLIVGSWARSRARLHRRRRRGWCLNCGYDLRGGGGVCPECGVG